jgi:hypothetical protein
MRLTATASQRYKCTVIANAQQHNAHSMTYLFSLQVVCSSMDEVTSCTAGAPAALMKAALIACGFVHSKPIHSSTSPQTTASHSTTAATDAAVIADNLTLQQQLELRGGGLTVVSSSLLPTGRSVNNAQSCCITVTCYIDIA